MRWVQSGPKEELTADYIAWWARASFMTGDVQQAKNLLGKLNRKTHFDGPRWVSKFARAVYQRAQDDARLENAAQDIESGM